MVEEAKFAVVRRIDDIELRRYESMILASVPGLPDNEAFGMLFRYITGNNRSREDIAMTAPVVSTAARQEKIAMTAPVVTDRESFAFVLPATYTMQTAPLPADPRIHLVEVKPRLVGVIRFRGYARQALVRKRTAELLDMLQKNSVQVVSQPFLMRYNPPFTPGFLRRNEIGVEVRL
jgi:hypothetical protein